jgi:hypothetical protein
VLKVNDVLETCYGDPEEHADDSNPILKLLTTISSTARDQTLPLLLSFTRRAMMCPRARIASTSSTRSARSAVRLLYSRRS